MTNFAYSPPEIEEGDLHSKAELEKIAAENIQDMIYQANPEILKNWLPIITAAFNAGKLGETLILAFTDFSIGDHEELRAKLRILETTNFSGEYQKLIAFETKMLRMREEFVYGNFDIVESIYEEISNLGGNPITRNNAEFISKYRCILSSYFYVQEKEKFFNTFQELNGHFKNEFGSIAQYNINNFQAMNLFLQGKYFEANEFALATLRLAEQLKVDGAYLPFESAYVLADTYLEFGDSSKSKAIIEIYLAKAIKFNQYAWVSSFYAKYAVYELQEGNLSGALANIRKGREAINFSKFNNNISLPLDIHELIIRIQLNDSERIDEILSRLPKNNISSGYKLALEMRNNPSSASEIIKLMPDQSDHEKFLKQTILTLIYIDNKSAANAHLEIAIEIAERNGYFRSFLYSPEPIRNLILDLSGTKRTVFLEKLSSAIRLQSSRFAESYATDHIPLTKRELDVLRRLGTKLPISKIAASLDISNNTIKTHLKNVYRKLNVDSREEAVSKGKELSLL